MARHHLNTQSGQTQPDAYLSELASLLHGPRGRRTRILAELRDGLQHAIDIRLFQGNSHADATKAAITEFGAPQAVARSFAGEMATAHARKTLTAYILTGPLVGIWWLALLRPYPWHGGLIALLAAIPVIPVVAIILGLALAALATTGSLIRWLPETHPRRALAITLTIAALVLIADATVITLYVRSGIPMRTLAVIACAASLIRIACGAFVILRTTAMRHRLREDHNGHR